MVAISGRKKEKGFSLIEIIVAISILTIGLLAIASMQVSAIKGNALSSSVTEASSLASDRLEKLLLAPYDDVSVDDGDGDGTDQDANDDGVDDDGGDFGLDDNTAATADNSDIYTNEQGNTYRVYWNCAIDEPTVSTKTIRVIVQWNEGGSEKAISLDLVKANI